MAGSPGCQTRPGRRTTGRSVLPPAAESGISRHKAELRIDCTTGRFAEMTAGRTWHYQGKGVQLGDKDAIVCWYRPKGSETCRVVYGDLSIEDVPPEDLPTIADPE